MRYSSPVFLVAIGLATFYFHLSYVGAAVLTALGIALLEYVRGEEQLTGPQAGFWTVPVGLMCLIATSFASNRYGLSFEALARDRSFPKLVRSLPFLSVVLLTLGAVPVIKSVFGKR